MCLEPSCDGLSCTAVVLWLVVACCVQLLSFVVTLTVASL